MATEWFYTQNDEQRGPVDDAELKRLTGMGVVGRSTLIWRAGMGEWEAAEKACAGLFPSPPPLPKVATVPPPIPNRPPPPVPGHAGPRRTLRFEATPTTGKSGTPPPTPPEQPPPASDSPEPQPKQASTPRYPLISIRGALIALVVACGAGIMGSLGGAVNSLPVFALFFLITMIAGLSVMVRGGILIYKSWQSIPMKYRSVSPSTTWLLLVPIFNLYQIFVSTIGLSRQTNRAFKDRNQSGIAPEGLAMAVSIAWVVGTAGPLVFTQIWLMYSTFVAQIVLAGLWIIEQARATNTLNGHTVAAEDFKPWRFCAAGAGGLAILIALVSGVAESAAKGAPVPPDVTMPGPILDDGGRGYAPQAQPQPQPQPYPRSQNSGWQYTDQPRQPAGNAGFPKTQNTGPKTCTTCDGSGTGPFTCTHCDGTGKSGTGSFKCSFCKGRGFPPCSQCNGTGQTRSSW